MKWLPSRLTPRTIPGQMWFVILIAVVAVVLAGEAIEREVSDGGLFQIGDTDRIVESAATVAALLTGATPAEKQTIIDRATKVQLDVEIMSIQVAAQRVANSAPISHFERIARYLFPPDYKLPVGGRRIAIDGRSGILLPIDQETVLVSKALPNTFQSTDFVNRATYYTLAVLTLIVAFSVYARQAVTAPLARISRELDRSNGASEDVLFAEKGAAEVISLARALNGMRTRIREMVDTRTRMLRSVSHDLRTPLTRLRLRTERLEDDELRQAMMSDIDHINALVDETLDYLRTDASGEDVERTDIASLMQTIQADFADVGFAVTYAGPDRLAGQCKPNALVRAVTNLCDNALKFGTHAAITLSTDSMTIRIDVADDGPGIPADQRKLVLEPFYKIDASRGTAKVPGFGLGLSIVSDIVIAHGGSLELHDNQPRGLVARLKIPAVDPNPKPPRRPLNIST